MLTVYLLKPKLRRSLRSQKNSKGYQRGVAFYFSFFQQAVLSNPGRARGRVLQQARHVRAMDQGRQGRHQMDAAVVPDVRGQRRAAPTSCARLQSGQFLADAGDARADQGLVTDKLEGEADQDRRESREPRPLCRLPN